MSAVFDLVKSPLPPGLTIIESSAGTGKTYAISHLVPRLLLEKQAEGLGNLALVTFTNDAASELAGRVRRVIELLAGEPGENEAEDAPGVAALRAAFPSGESRRILRRALLEIDELNVSTIHSFCQRVLQSEGMLCGFPAPPELQPDAGGLIEELVGDLWEEKVARDTWIAGLAAVGGCSVGADVRLVSSLSRDAEFEPLPDPVDLRERTERIAKLVEGLNSERIAEAQAVFVRVGTWNANAPDAEGLKELFAVLGDFQPGRAGPYFQAVRRLAESPKWIQSKSREGRTLCDELEASETVRLARDLDLEVRHWSWDWRIFCLREVRLRLGERLRSGRLTTYDGLIDAVLEALGGPRGERLAEHLRARYRVALIDESQDTDARQMEIFRRIFADGERDGRRLILIGDPKQAIYGFRGADVNTYLEAKANPGAVTYELNKTYRSPQPLVNAVNAVFQRPGTLLREGLDFFPAESGMSGDWELVVEGEADSARLEFWIAPDELGKELSRGEDRLERIAGVVADEIARLLRRGALLRRQGVERPVRPGDFAVLAGEHKQAAVMEAALRNAGVPSVRAGGESVFNSEEAEGFLMILRALDEPRRGARRNAALATRLLGFSAREIRGMERSAEISEKVRAGFLRWRELLEREGMEVVWAEMDRDFVQWFPGREESWVRLGIGAGGERRLTNVRHLLDLLQEAESAGARRAGELTRWLEGEIRWGAGGEEGNLVRLESDEDAVKIGTMHAAKGLEYPLVFCPFLWTAHNAKGLGRVHPPGQEPQWINLDLAGEELSDVIQSLNRATIEDRLRLAYVALTRAQVKVWVVGGQLFGTRGARAEASALDWLLRSDGEVYSPDWSRGAGSEGRGTRHAEGVACLQAGCEGQVGNEGPLTWRNLPEYREEVWKSDMAPVEEVVEAVPKPVIPQPWTITSFSALTRESHPHGEFAGGALETAAVAEDAREAEELGWGNEFAEAPGGAVMGTALHDWIERWDFGVVDEEAVSRHLKNYVLPAKAGRPLERVVAGMLEKLREAVLPGWGCAMREACGRREASEWHFQLPIRTSLGPRELAEVFAAHGQEAYAELLARLPSAELSGYLQGFLDRIAVNGDEWGVVDWKTNKLAGGYGEDALRECAWSSHYWLQAHLYLVALGRYRRMGLNRDGSGVSRAWLVFLRGIEEGTSGGILPISPTEGLLADLDGLFYTA